MLNATPASSAERSDQPSQKRLTSIAARKGSRNETKPIATLAFQCRRSDTGSISAPARKVSVTDPMAARNVVKAVCSTSPETPGKLPAAVPTRISASATAMPARMLTIDARRASATHTAAIAYVFNRSSSPLRAGCFS